MTAPNRIFRLAELDRPDYRRVTDALDELTARDNVSYLHPSKRWEYPWALERARLAPHSRILDVGCGASIFPVFLARQGHEVHAVDLDVPQGLDDLHSVRVHYRRADLTATLPYPDDHFDAIFCISVIEHIGHDRIGPALQELRRMLRPGGRLLLTTDYYRDATARLTYEGPDRSFPVDWDFFDEDCLNRFILNAPGWRLEGHLDLNADWPSLEPQMKTFHGYPYTAVGIALIKSRCADIKPAAAQ